ncbi:alpha/beta fold hydrolase [Kalamiella sp. sgz302252]|uniref:alpha/beta fold hydrolase n=1 Tax=Pantoea sp. sgz302252 TaxID=3341827 RepID=UPI0036D36CA1
MTDNTELFFHQQGKGPLVVLLHGLLMDGKCWQQSGLPASLSQNYRVVMPDLPGHGHSLAWPDGYNQQAMATAVIALLDRLGYAKAHILGYSAGGWLAAGLLKYYPQRLSSVIIGGWDCINGLPQGPNGALSFAEFMTFARETAPELAGWVSAREEPALNAFFDLLSQPQQVEEELKRRAVPALFWAGREDLCYPTIARWAADCSFPLLTAEGDHLAAVREPGAALIKEICRFIARAEIA